MRTMLSAQREFLESERKYVHYLSFLMTVCVWHARSVSLSLSLYLHSLTCLFWYC